MANHKSAVKRMRQTDSRRARNRAVRSKLRTSIKKFRVMASESKKKECEAALPDLVSLIDRTLKSGIIHENTAGRLKSRLTCLANSIPAE